MTLMKIAARKRDVIQLAELAIQQEPKPYYKRNTGLNVEDPVISEGTVQYIVEFRQRGKAEIHVIVFFTQDDDAFATSARVSKSHIHGDGHWSHYDAVYGDNGWVLTRDVTAEPRQT